MVLVDELKMRNGHFKKMKPMFLELMRVVKPQKRAWPREDRVHPLTGTKRHTTTTGTAF